MSISPLSVNRVPTSTPLQTLGSWLRLIYSVTAVLFIMTVGSLLMLLVGLVTLFQCRRLYTEVLAKALGWTALRAVGVKVVVHQEQPWPRTQTVYVSNHTSTLDLFVLIALGLPNARFFLSGFLRKNIPLGIMGYMTGTIWTVPQEFPEERRRIFQRAERILRRTGESVYLSPEGGRITTGEIGHFNKGSFHLATALHAPIVPFYIQIAPEMDPGAGWNVRPGTVHVHVKPPIRTADWRVEDLDANRQYVRDLFVQWHEELRSR